jgi:YD repeat-containing protein
VNRLVDTLVASPTNPTVRDSVYTLDGGGNRLNVTSDPPPGNYTVAGTVNQYSVTPFDTARQYDANGNVTSLTSSAGTETFQYDYRNLIVRTAVGASTPIIYAYDALGRRIQKSVGGVITRYIPDLEEQDGIGNTLATFVVGRDSAQPLTMRRGSSDYYYHADDRGNVMVLSDAAGSVAERYEYGDYGEPSIGSAAGNPYFFAGRRYDAETGLYDDLTRYFDPVIGSNGYTYAGNNPWRSATKLEFTIERACEPVIIVPFFGPCGTSCASYACCQKPVKSCQTPRCGIRK